jgi:hypothetical protein
VQEHRVQEEDIDPNGAVNLPIQSGVHDRAADAKVIRVEEREQQQLVQQQVSQREGNDDEAEETEESTDDASSGSPATRHWVQLRPRSADSTEALGIPGSMAGALRDSLEQSQDFQRATQWLTATRQLASPSPSENRPLNVTRLGSSEAEESFSELSSSSASASSPSVVPGRIATPVAAAAAPPLPTKNPAPLSIAERIALARQQLRE